MKKFLSLVLALVMAMSLVTVSAGAKDFADNSSISYDDAVAVISELGIVDGYTDGSFGPTNTLTRQAAAKIICNLILGPTTASALSADAAPYSDVPTTSEFAGYIAYCQQQGIISGYADGTFRPSNTLTGYAFMKMLLGALGYDSDIESFTGANWSIQVGKLALGIGLDDGNDAFVGTDAVTREEACLYAFNTLKATMVEYSNSSTITVGDVTVVSNANRSDVENSTKTDGNIADDGLMQFAEKYFTNLKKDNGNDAFGRPSVTWYVKSTEIGTYVNTEDLVESWTKKVTKSALYTAVGSSIVDDLEDGDATLYYWVDGIRTVVDEDDISDFMAKNSSSKINDGDDTGNGSLTEVYVDDDNNVTVVVIYTYVFQATADYSSSSDSVKIAAAGDTAITLDSYTLDGDDFDIKDITEDEYLLINATRVSSSNKYEVQSVNAAELVSGEVEAYTDGDDVTVDGETYSYSVKSGDVSDEIDSTGGTVTLVLDNYGYVIAIDDTIVSGNYVFITDADNATLLSSSAVVADAYFADGTNDTITLKKVAGSTSKTTMKNAAGWYTYSVDSSDKYTLSKVSSSYSAWADIEGDADDETPLLNNGASKLPITADGTTVRANESTVFVVVDMDGDVGVYTGISEAPDVSVGEGEYMIGYVWKTSSGYATYVFVSVDGNETGDVDDSTADDSYVFVTKFSSKKGTTSDTYYVYKAIVDGEEVEIETEDNGYDIMTLYRKVRYSSSTERITSMTAVTSANTDEFVHLPFTNKTVDYSSGVLTVGSYDFLVNSGSQLSLILNYSQTGDGISSAPKDADVKGLMEDESSKYEAISLGGSSLKSTLSGYKVSGYIFAVVEDDYDGGDGNVTLDALFLYIDGATYTGTSSSSSSTSLDGIEVTVNSDRSIDVAVDDPDTDEDDMLEAVIAALEDEGYEVGAITEEDDGTYTFTATKGSLTRTFTWDPDDVTQTETGAEADQATVDAAKTAVESLSLSVSGVDPAYTDTEDDITDILEAVLDDIEDAAGSDVEVALSKSRTFKAAENGAEDEDDGTDGSVKLVLTLTKNEATATATVTVTLKALPYEETDDGIAAAEEEADANSALTAAKKAIQKKATTAVSGNYSEFEDIKNVLSGLIEDAIGDDEGITFEIAEEYFEAADEDDDGEAEVTVTLTYTGESDTEYTDEVTVTFTITYSE